MLFYYTHTCQVIALHVRSNLLSGPGVIVNEGSKAHERKGLRARLTNTHTNRDASHWN